MMNTRYWIGVVSRDHVKAARAGGFCQFCHGKVSPVKRLNMSDGIVYYSPRASMGSGELIRAFTVIGRVRTEEIYQVEQLPGFHPWRREIDYWSAKEATIAPLLGKLSFSANNANWGWRMRQGFFEITEADFFLIAQAMQVQKA